MSQADSVDAAMCKACHEARGSASDEDVWSTGTGMCKVAMGVAVTVIGNQSSVQDYFVTFLGDNARYIHYAMIALVIALIATGVIAVLRAVVKVVREWLSWQPSIRNARPIYIGVALLVALLFGAAYFPPQPSVDAAVNRQLAQWAGQIAKAQMGTGAIREHPQQGVGQAWITAQCLSAIGVQFDSSWQTNQWVRAASFLERTQIGHFRVRPSQAADLRADLGANRPLNIDDVTGDAPSVAFLYDSASSALGGSPLTAALVQKLEEERSHLVEGQVNDEGWGYFEQFNWGVTEITAWVLVSEVAALRSPALLSKEQIAHGRVLANDLVTMLMQRQNRSIGGFSPVRDTRPEFARTYSTIMAVWALSEAASADLNILPNAVTSPRI